ncbi:MAG: hypothetical protein J0I80_03180 [Sphingomonas sp.]|nr:hypothetical protein [Sphingomonas sp.]
MPRVLAAASSYFAAIFALGFALGVIRTLWLAPALGATPAVLVELPVMLGASWLVAQRLISTPPAMAPAKALRVGALAFAMLMAAEALLAVTLGGRSLAHWAADLIRTPGWIGLAGQIVFGLMAWLAAMRRLRSPEH